jgi:HAD superfamily hydrolase (TIGR01450 family)
VTISSTNAKHMPLLGAGRPLVELYDAALLDLDGVVYIGRGAVDGATSAIAAARAAGVRLAFVTNNAARTPEDVAAHLREIGVAAQPADVVTSAQAAARLVAARVPRGAEVLVVGGEGLDSAVREHELLPTRTYGTATAAVVQGFSPDVGWCLLTEGTLAVRRGLPWIVSNADRTLPTPRGSAPGNGALVEVIRVATGHDPDAVAGKPQLPLHHEAMLRTQATRPLVVGDRLDTDIEGAVRANCDSLLVLTGVTTPRQVVLAPVHHRPTYLGPNLGALMAQHPAPVESNSGTWACGPWTAWVQGRKAMVRGDGRPYDGLRALCAAAWSAAPDALDRTAVDDALREIGF